MVYHFVWGRIVENVVDPPHFSKYGAIDQEVANTIKPRMDLYENNSQQSEVELNFDNLPHEVCHELNIVVIECVMNVSSFNNCYYH